MNHLERMMLLLSRDVHDTEPSYYLATFNDGKLINLDGSHSTIKGVAQAKKLMHALRLHNDGDEYVMLTLSPVPAIDVLINKDAAAMVGAAVERYRHDH